MLRELHILNLTQKIMASLRPEVVRRKPAKIGKLPWRSPLRIRPVAPESIHLLPQNVETRLVNFGCRARYNIFTHRLFGLVVQERNLANRIRRASVARQQKSLAT